MARRSTPPKPERPALTVEQKRRGIARLQQRIKELEAFDPQSVQRRFTDPNVTALETAIAGTLSAIFGHGTVEYDRYEMATRLDHGPVSMVADLDFGGGSSRRDDSHEARQYVAEGKQQAIVLLRQAIQSIEEEIEDQDQDQAPSPIRRAPPRKLSKVFVVHGHDEAALHSVARFLEQLGLDAIVLREQPDQGRTIIEKFEDCAAEVGFAVVLLTPDDLGAAPAAPARAPWARQNVVFELGYFAGRLGRGRTCLMRKGDVEIPSDLYGVIYTDLDPSEAWKMKLVKELRAAGLDFDANRMWS